MEVSTSGFKISRITVPCIYSSSVENIIDIQLSLHEVLTKAVSLESNLFINLYVKRALHSWTRERSCCCKKKVKWIWKQEQALFPPFGPESKVSFQRLFMSTRPVARVISADINCLLTPKRFKIYQAESKGI